MKVVYIVSNPFFYNQYIENNFYKGKVLTYDSMINVFMEDCVGSCVSYNRYGKEFGAESYFINMNCKPLQLQWAKENNISFTEENWKYTIAFEQVKKLRPDIVFTGAMFDIFDDFFTSLKPYVKKFFCWIASPIANNVSFKNIDLVITSLPTLVQEFKNMGLKSELLNAAFDEYILKKLMPEKDNIEVSFIGGLSAAHNKRVAELQKFAKKVPTKIWGYGIGNLEDKRNRVVRKILGPTPIIKNYKGECWGQDMYNKLAASKITFNSHIELAGSYAVNMRMFEATGCGTLLLTDGKNSKLKFFEDKKHVLFYESIDEAIELANYYLQNEKERKAIAKAGQDFTLSNYNYRTTTQKLISIFQKYI
jgi:spore maturation protein CgeB